MTRSLSIRRESDATESVLKDLALQEKRSALTRARWNRNTYLLMGTPASSRASVPAHTVAIEDEPLLSVMVLSSRHTNGKSSSPGMTGANARSAKLP
jgi:hypothetical protein